MKKLFITLCGIAVISSISGFATAQEKGCPKNFSPEMKAKMEQKRAEFDKRLNLTAEQKEKMKAIHEESRIKIKPLFERLKTEKTKLNQLKASNAPAADIKNQKEKLHSIKAQLKEIRKADFEKIQSILTPEQQKEFNKMHEENKKNRMEHMKNRKGKFEKE